MQKLTDDYAWVGPADPLKSAPVVTEEMVERALEEMMMVCDWGAFDREQIRRHMRAALEAALS